MRVLLVRLDGVGDAAVCVPLLAALREAGHGVGVALTTRNAGMFSPRAIVAEHVLERIPWPAHGSTPASTRRALAEIARERYDVALIATEEPEGFALAAAVPRRVGFSTGWTRPLKSLWVRARTTRTVSRSQRIGAETAHEAEVMYRLGAQLGLAPAPPAEASRTRPMLRDTPSPRDEARPVLVQLGPKWLATGIAPRAVRALVAELAPLARVVAAPGEAETVREMSGVMPEVFATLPAWIEALDGAAIVVTVDTGAAHVAGMLGTPVVDVFPDAHFEAQVRRWRPWASRYTALRASDVGGGRGTRLIEAVRDGL